jgi:hypothetical protein
VTKIVRKAPISFVIVAPKGGFIISVFQNVEFRMLHLVI